MRNLKRVLSLALALVMVLGMMVITTSAATFADKDEITYTEAVDVISAIGVITGDNGSFYPNRALTREEGAALICYLLMGKDKADKLVGSGNFADVASNRWSAGEIDYCANLGIILGYTDADGKQVFNPKGELTAVAYGRMLLGALGYDGGIEGYTGTNWASSIAADMIDVGLDVRGVDMDAVLTREQAAQMTLQALKSPMVKYTDKGSSIVIGGVEISTGASEAEERTDVNKTNDTPAVEIGYNDDQDGKLQFCEKYFPTLYLKADTDNDADAYGRPAHTWYYGGTAPKNLVGVYADKASATVLVTGMKNNTIAKIADELGYDDKGVTKSLNVGDVVEIYANYKGEVTDAVVLEQKLGQITKVVKTTDPDAKYTYDVTVKVGNTLTPYKDTTLVGFDADTMVEKSYVTIIQGTNTAIVAAADKVTGVKTAVGDGYVKVAGNKYEYSGNLWGTADQETNGTALDYTSTYDFYLDDNGYVIGVVMAKKAADAIKVFYVDDSNFVVGDDFAGQKAQLSVVNLDGTKEIVNMAVTKADHDSNTATPKKDCVKVGGSYVALDGNITSKKLAGVSDDLFYAYTVNADGEITNLTAVTAGGIDTNGDTKADTAYATAVDFEEKKAIVDINDGDYTKYATADTTVTVINKNAGKATTITGYANFDGTDYGTTQAVYTYAAGTLKEVYILDTTVMSVASDTIYGWYVETGDTYLNAEQVTVTDVVYNVNGVDTTYTIMGTSVVEDLVSIVVDKGIATVTDYTTGNSDKENVVLGTVYSDYVLIGSTPTYFNNGVKFYDVTNVNKNGVVEIDEITEDSIVSYTVVNGGANDGKIIAVYVLYAAQEDGLISINLNSDAGQAYYEHVLQLIPAELNNVMLNKPGSYAVFQHSRPAGTNEISITVKDANGNGVSGWNPYTFNSSVTGTVGFLWYVDKNTGVDAEYQTYTVEIMVNDEVVLSGSCELTK